MGISWLTQGIYLYHIHRNAFTDFIFTYHPVVNLLFQRRTDSFSATSYFSEHSPCCPSLNVLAWDPQFFADLRDCQLLFFIHFDCLHFFLSCVVFVRSSCVFSVVFRWRNRGRLWLILLSFDSKFIRLAFILNLTFTIFFFFFTFFNFVRKFWWRRAFWNNQRIFHLILALGRKIRLI